MPTSLPDAATPLSPDAEAVRSRFSDAVQAFDRSKPVWVLGHNDADGLSATALFARAFQAAGWAVRTRTVGRGESPWSPDMRREFAGVEAGGLVITDLGVRDGGPKARNAHRRRRPPRADGRARRRADHRLRP